MTDAPPVSIQEVSRRSGLSEPTLRYYEKIGLIGPVPRDASSGHRRYGAAAVERIEALSCLKATGTSVHDMRAYLRHLDAAADDDRAAQLRGLFRRNADRVAEELRRTRVRLRYLRLKTDLWDARERGDEEAERRAVEELTRTVPELMG
ncbi:MerR family transcriptional regulator [Actinacidiphila glaucinigra]|uniref:DNA-binding transcriptional regulator, MerR family n=1 Tax=Actinacidiphila glaucinigra TaxID=235986 RepID=A0A239DJN0_9ACTN|nr:MerR family transcriptional regulator [Actinacidiphila glaucinigra]SNS32617.1 DNA-binding transcriptional regulator, MerR family [Actinacidiphila glaucinigra]